MKIRKTFLALICMVSMNQQVFSSEDKNLTLELHFDVNGTVMLADPAQGKTIDRAIMQEIADTTMDDWGSGVHTSYRDYVNGLPEYQGDEVADPELKKKRRTAYANMVQDLETRNHPMAEKIRDLSGRAAARAKNQKGLLFASFWNLIDWMDREKFTYHVVFRTFGKDIPDIQEELGAHGLKLDNVLVYERGNLKADGIDGRDYAQHMYAMVRDRFNAVQDDHKYWSEVGHEKRDHGKPFVVSSDSKTVRLFLDDNIADLRKEIIRTMDENGDPLDVQTLIDRGVLVRVEPLRAHMEDDYFIKLVQQSLGKNGY